MVTRSADLPYNQQFQVTGVRTKIFFCDSSSFGFYPLIMNVSNSTISETYSINPTYHVLFFVLTPCGIFFQLIVIITILIYRKIFNRSFYVIVCSLGIANLITMIFMMINFIVSTMESTDEINIAFSTVTTWIYTYLGAYPCYLFQIAQALNRLAAIVAYSTYDKIFTRNRLIFFICCNVIFCFALMSTIAIWHCVTASIFENFENSDAWALHELLDSIMTPGTVIGTSIIYVAAMISLRWIRSRSATGSNQSKPSTVEIKLTFHGIIVLGNLITSEILFMTRNYVGEIYWQFFAILSFAADPMVLIVLDTKLRGYVFTVLRLKKTNSVSSGGAHVGAVQATIVQSR